jgi:chromosome segregation ATPase
MGLDIGQWIGLSSFILSAALAFNGYRSTQVTALRQRIEDLEQQVKEIQRNHDLCESELRRARRDNDWLMDKLRGGDRPQKEGRQL